MSQTRGRLGLVKVQPGEAWMVVETDISFSVECGSLVVGLGALD